MTRFLIPAVCLFAVGCYDDHGRFDAGVDAFSTPDAMPVGDAWGDANVDAGPGPCVVEGRAVAGLPDSRPDRIGCACPMDTVPGIAFRAPAPLAVSGGPFVLCVPPRSNGRAGITHSLCSEGQTLHHFQGERAEAMGVEFSPDVDFGFGCMDAASCLFAETQLPEAMRGGCLYSDYTAAVSGMIAPQDCVLLSGTGLCSINCGCDDLSYPECFGLSETHPVGACAVQPWCTSDSQCLGGCMFVANFPDFAFEDIYQTVPAGRCMRPGACMELRSQTGDTWACGPSVPR